MPSDYGPAKLTGISAGLPAVVSKDVVELIISNCNLCILRIREHLCLLVPQNLLVPSFLPLLVAAEELVRLDESFALARLATGKDGGAMIYLLLLCDVCVDEFRRFVHDRILAEILGVVVAAVLLAGGGLSLHLRYLLV